jgi:outer membrane lipoprotein-sorting protein
LLATVIVGGATAYAQTPEGKGLSIVRAAEARESGWKDIAADVVMTLRNSRGDESIRNLRMQSLEREDGGDRSLVVFDQPTDVRGTALLTHAHKTSEDEQWLYLPALKRVKRIAGANKSGPFMGSEFAYEDLTTPEIEKYQYKFLRDESLDGAACYVIERIPADKQSGYSRQVIWLEQAEYRLVKTEFYDRKGDLQKTLVISVFQKYLDRYWRAEKFNMVNHLTGKSTEILWKNITFRQGLTDRDFDVNSLSRAR